MSNSLIYQEFRKKVGKKTIQNVAFIRTQCKNCKTIIEYPKTNKKKHKGYCVKCKGTDRILKLIGKKFGHLSVINQVENKRKGHSLWLCRCLCGNEIICVGAMLLRNHYKSCGCRHGLTLKEYIKSKVKVTEDGKWLWQGSLDKDGYGQANWQRKEWKAHRLSYTAFVGEIPKSMCVCHKNDFPQDVNPENLFISDIKGNNIDKMLKNRQVKGSKNGNAKLTEKQVKEIKKRIYEGVPLTHLAKEYCVNHTTILKINSNEIWSHIPCPKGINNYERKARKLSRNDVKEIKKMLNSGNSGTQIANFFMVSISLISNIKNGKIWNHVPWPDNDFL